MPKGVKASPKQVAAGRRNVVKAHVSKLGKRGGHYKPRSPRM